MKRLIALFVLFCTVSLNACSGDKYDKYIGLWEGEIQRVGKTHVIFKIEKRGETYVQTFKIFDNKIRKNADDVVLSKRDGQLIIDYGIATTVIAFGENTDTIITEGGTLKRITQEHLDKMTQEIEDRENKCKQMISDATKSFDEIDKRTDIKSEEKSNLQCDAYKKYKALYDETKCELWSAWELQIFRDYCGDSRGFSWGS